MLQFLFFLSYFFVNAETRLSGLPAAPRAAFAALYDSLGLATSKSFRRACPRAGDPRRPQTPDICSWCAKKDADVYIRCSKDNKGIVTISLANLNLRGTLPEGISGLAGLKQLILTNNTIDGSIPSSIGRLTDLQEIYLQQNALTGAIPASIGSIRGLAFFVASYNRIESFPTELVKTSLEFLDLGFNRLRGTLPSQLGRLKRLKYLSINNNFYNGTIPRELFSLTSLRFLTMGGNSLSGTIPSTISSLRDLSTLALGNNRLSGPLASGIFQITALRTLYLQSNKLSGTIPAQAILNQLTDLRLQENALTGQIPAEIFKSLHKLVYLNVSTNFLAGSIPPTISALTSLQLFDARNNVLTGTVPSDFGGSLQSLNLMGNKIAALPTSLARLTALRVLDVSNNEISGTLPSELASLVNLHTLNVAANRLEGSIPSAFGALSNLLSLNLSINSLSHGVPSTLTMLNRTLNSLDLSNNEIEGRMPPLSAFRVLSILKIDANSLSGPLTQIFDEETQRNLNFVSLSANKFSGELPAALFRLPSLKTLIASINCFEGSLPEDVCRAANLEFLVLNGLTAGCTTKFWGDSAVFSSTKTRTSMKGSIPACLFAISKLRALHLSGNGFSGQLPSRETYGLLQDISLSYNQLAGAIPQSMLAWGARLRTFDFAFNRLGGSLAAYQAYLGPSGSSFHAEVNRLSGFVPHSVLLLNGTNLRVLEGNLFDCHASRSDLPHADPYLASYSCGSVMFDRYFYFWLTLVAVIFFGFVSFRRFEAVRYLYNCLAKPPDGELARRCPHLHSLYKFRILAALLGCALSVVVLPCYAVMAQAGATTYKATYSWTVSAGFKTGMAPAVTCLVIWAALFVALHAYVRYIWPLKGGPASLELNNSPPTITSVGKLFIIAADACVFVCINIFFIIYNERAGVSGQIASKFWLSLFKFLANKVATKVLDGHEDHRYFFCLAFINSVAAPCLATAFCLSTCFKTAIFAPPPVRAIYTEPSCSFSISPNFVIVNETSLSHSIGISSFGVAEDCSEQMAMLQYQPPVYYGYECSSFLLAAYAPVFVTGGVLILGELLLAILARWLLDNCRLDKHLRRLLLKQVLPTLSLSSAERKECEIPTTTDLLDQGRFYRDISSDLVLLLTFGVAFPLVGVVYTIVVAARTWFLQDRIAALLSDELLPMQNIEVQYGGAATYFAQTLWLALVLCPFFLSFFLMDMAGDVAGPVASLFLFPMVFVPSGLAILADRLKIYRVSTTGAPLPSRTPLPACEPRPEMSEQPSKDRESFEHGNPLHVSRTSAENLRAFASQRSLSGTNTLNK